MAGFVLITNGQYFSWQSIALVILGQIALAFLDALKKYYSASNQLPLSALFDLVRQDAASKVPTVQYTPNQQAIVNSVNALLAQTDTSPNAAQNAAKPLVLAPTPTESTAQGAQPTESVTQTEEYKIPADAQTITTLPNLAAIQQNRQNTG